GVHGREGGAAGRKGLRVQPRLRRRAFGSVRRVLGCLSSVHGGVRGVDEGEEGGRRWIGGGILRRGEFERRALICEVCVEVVHSSCLAGSGVRSARKLCESPRFCVYASSSALTRIIAIMKREGVMQLGIVAVDLSVFVSSQLQDKQMGVECLIAHSSPSFEARLCGPTDNSSPPDICRSYLRFAVELFKSALGLVKEHERHQTKLQTDVQTHWENRQHLLLRGRAQHNLGRALFELAQLKARSKQGRPVNGMSHFKSPGNEFQKAVETARQIRNDSRAVESYAEAPAWPWVSKARLQALDALGLEALASGLLAECFLKTNRVNDATSLLSSVFDSIALSAIASADEDKVDSEVVAHALEELYLFAMTVAESSTRILEASVGSKIMCAEFGAQCLALTKLALEHASSVSDVLLPYIDQHSLDVEVTIASRSSIEREENAILHWWQSVKDQGRNLVSSSAVSARDIANTLPRPDLAATTAREMDLLHPPPLVRRSFVLDSHSLQRRSRQATTSSNRRNDKDARVRKDLASAATKEVEQRKWGDEMLTKQLRRCCPPLPRVNEDLGITTKVLDALKKKLGNVLPCDEYGHVYCQ
ncbi:hypothetical protein THAOC_04414, partial [Thalassiosira oceanica]